MRETCESGASQSFSKRVSVRSGGAGHAHSGVIKASALGTSATAQKRAKPKATNGKIVKLGR